MARRRTIGLGTLLVAGGVAWWLFGRSAGSAVPARVTLSPRAIGLTDENVNLLKTSGLVPATAVAVYEDPLHVGPAAQIAPGEYVVGPMGGAGPAAGAGVSGFGSLLYPTDVYATPLVEGGGPSITPGLWF